MRSGVFRRRPAVLADEPESPATQALSLAQRLPEDVVCDMFHALEAIDPPRYAGPANLLSMGLVSQKEDFDSDIHPAWCGPRDANWHDRQTLELRRSLYHTHSSLGWIALTHVCSLYRRVGVHLCPSLWGRMIQIFPEALDTVLERARNAPLSFDFAAMRNLAPRYQNRYAELAKANTARIEHLSTWSYISSPMATKQLLVLIGGLLPHIYESHLPAMRVLNIEYPASSVRPAELQPLSAPRMEQLVLVSTPLLRPAAPLLRSLVLKNLSPMLAVADLLDLLCSTPRLEELEIIFSLADKPAEPESLPTAELPCLSAVRWYLDTENARVLWLHMRVPLSAMVHIHLFAEGQQADDAGSGALLLDALGARLADPAINALTVVNSRSGFAVSLASFSGEAASAAPTTRTCIIMRYNTLVLYFGSIPGLLAHVLDRATPENIRVLHASPCPPVWLLGAGVFGVRDLYEQMRRLAALEVLSVSWLSGRFQAFFDVLDEPGALAHIGTLVVRSVDVRESEMPRIVGGEEGVRAAVARRWAEIAGVLARRAERGCAGPVLVLRGVKRGMFEALEAEAVAGDVGRFTSRVLDERTLFEEASAAGS